MTAGDSTDKGLVVASDLRVWGDQDGREVEGMKLSMVDAPWLWGDDGHFARW